MSETTGLRRYVVGYLKNAGADVSHVRKENGVSTGIAMIIVTENNNRIILDKGANACLTKEDIDEFLKDAGEGDVYLTQLENPIEIVGYGLKKAKEKGLYTVLNPAPANKCIAAYFPYVDLITPNESELRCSAEKRRCLRREYIKS